MACRSGGPDALAARHASLTRQQLLKGSARGRQERVLRAICVHDPHAAARERGGLDKGQAINCCHYMMAATGGDARLRAQACVRACVRVRVVRRVAIAIGDGEMLTMRVAGSPIERKRVASVQARARTRLLPWTRARPMPACLLDLATQPKITVCSGAQNVSHLS